MKNATKGILLCVLCGGGWVFAQSQGPDGGYPYAVRKMKQPPGAAAPALRPQFRQLAEDALDAVDGLKELLSTPGSVWGLQQIAAQRELRRLGRRAQGVQESTIASRLSSYAEHISTCRYEWRSRRIQARVYGTAGSLPADCYQDPDREAAVRLLELR